MIIRGWVALLASSILFGGFAQRAPAAVAEPVRTIVVFIGGIDSTLDGGGNWDLLKNELQSSFGFSDTDFYEFSYNPADANVPSAKWYSPSDTCIPVNDSEQHLASMLRSLRDSRRSEDAVLVGHSLGGVVAIQSLIDYPDLTTAGAPYVRSVIVADAPFGGVTAWASLVYRGCAAIDELVARRQQQAYWQSSFRTGAEDILGRGTRIEVITNDLDDLVGVGSQCICGLGIHLPLSVDGPESGHAAVFYSPDAVEQMAIFIGAQRQ